MTGDAGFDDERPCDRPRRLDRGHRVIRAPWENYAPTLSPVGDPWVLYDLRDDWAQSEGVAATYPATLQELQKLFWQEART